MKFKITSALVESESNPNQQYELSQDIETKQWSCTCMAAKHFPVDCKHIKFMKTTQGEDKKKLTKEDLINGTYATPQE